MKFYRGDKVQLVRRGWRDEEELFGAGTIYRGPHEGRYLIALFGVLWAWVSPENLRLQQRSKPMRSRQQPDDRSYRSPFEPNTGRVAEINIRHKRPDEVKTALAGLPADTRTLIVHGRLPSDALGGSDPVRVNSGEVEAMARAVFGRDVAVCHVFACLHALFEAGDLVGVSGTGFHGDELRQRERMRTVDLHQRLDNARWNAREAILNAFRDGVGQLRLIHGKGLHNPGGRQFVLRDWIDEILCELKTTTHPTLRWQTDRSNAGVTCVVFE